MFFSSLFYTVHSSLKGVTKIQLLAWLCLVIFIFADIFFVYSHALRRYTTYHALAYDMGNMDQVMWNTLHGHFFRFTNGTGDWQGPPIRLGAHVEPIILPLSLFYFVHSGPETLLFVQTVSLALGSIPLFLLARRKFPLYPFIAVAFAGAYLVAPGVLGEVLYDFHPVALATPLLLLSLWALDARRYKIFAIAAVLAASCKEEVALSIIPLGLYIAFWQKKVRFGITVLLISFIWVSLCFFIIMPHFNGTGFSIYANRYSWLGTHNNNSESFFVVNDPNSIPRYKYLMLLFLTGGGFSLFCPLWLIPLLPEVFINIFSRQTAQYSGLAQYNAVIIPFLFASSVYGAATFYACFKKKQIQFIIPFTIAILLITSILNLITVRKQLAIFLFDNTQPRQQQKKIDSLLLRIPQSASVATTQTLNAHVSERYTLYLLSNPKSYSAQYIAIDLYDKVWQRKNAEVYHSLIQTKKYYLLGIAGNVVLLKRLKP